MFQALDHHNKNYLNADDVKKMMINLGINFNEFEARALLSLCDSSGSGNLGLKDFIKFLKVPGALLQPENSGGKVINSEVYDPLESSKFFGELKIFRG